MHTPDLYKFKSSLKQIEDPLEKLDYVIVNAMEASNELGQIEAQQYWGKQNLGLIIFRIRNKPKN